MSDLLNRLDELIDLCATGEGESQRVVDLASDLRSASRVVAHVENETRRDLVNFGRKQGSCEICGGPM